MSEQLADLLDFVSFTLDIRNVKRALWVREEEQFENDSEHGYQLAMVAMYLIETDKLDLDVFRSMGIALVHDVLEVHAGDTPAFASDEIRATKADREKAAIEQLVKDWPRLTLMHDLIQEYETKSTKESRFVYALDKPTPILNNYLDGGRSWKLHKLGLSFILEAKNGKVTIDPTVTTYYQETLELLKQNPQLFGK